MVPAVTFSALSRVYLGTQGHPTGAISGEGGEMAGAGMASGAGKAADILEVAAVIDQIRRELRRRTGQDWIPRN